MLHAAQPWLPLLDPGPEAALPLRTPRRRQVRAVTSQPAVAVVARPAEPAQAREALHPGSSPGLPSGLHPGELRALRTAVLGLVIRWDLSGREALTLLGEPLGGEEERLERMQALSRVSLSLLSLFPERERCRGFLRAPCPALDGAVPLDLMLAEGQPGIARVRAHLTARVAG